MELLLAAGRKIRRLVEGRAKFTVKIKMKLMASLTHLSWRGMSLQQKNCYFIWNTQQKILITISFRSGFSYDCFHCSLPTVYFLFIFTEWSYPVTGTSVVGWFTQGFGAVFLQVKVELQCHLKWLLQYMEKEHRMEWLCFV